MSSCIHVVIGSIRIGRGYPAEEDDFPPPAFFAFFWWGLLAAQPTSATLLHFTFITLIRMETGIRSHFERIQYN